MPPYDHVPAAKIFVCSILINLTSFNMTFFLNIDQGFHLNDQWPPHNKKLFKQEI